MASDQIIVRYPALREVVQRNEGRFQEAVQQRAEASAPENPQEQIRLVAAFNNAWGELKEHDTGTTVMASTQNELASRIQTAIVEDARERGMVSEIRPAREISVGGPVIEMGRLLEVKFDSHDVFPWIWMSRLLLFPPEPAQWLTPPEKAECIDNQAVVAVFSDWGTGLYGAPGITKQIQLLPRCDVALHMGDTYYCGSKDEITTRLVELWPIRPKTVHRTLNGNHEMYSGGVGYFAALGEQPFGQSSSCIAMQNDHWLLLGLDTSYHEASIDTQQVEWVTRMVSGASGLKVLLFSHHQVYSKFEKPGTGENLRTMLDPLLTEGRIYGWFFGHEHRLVVFDPKPEWNGMKARCMGHGGFPEFRNDDLPGSQPDRTQWIPIAVAHDVPAGMVLDGPNPYINDKPSDPHRFAPHGYLVLNFDGPAVYETYFDPAGAVTRERTEL